ncbi:retrotransposon protein, putative, ty1-copia subclass [Tanacetum coccineum]
MLENGLWFIHNHPLILKKWNPNVNLLKEDVGNVLVWVKLHGVPVMTFREDGLSVIATKLGTSLILDSYTFDMCLQSWGRSSYARAMTELRADIELKDTIVVAMPKITGEGFYTYTVCVYKWKPPRGVSVGPKLGFKPTKEYRPVSKKPTANTSVGYQCGTSNLASNGANSSGSSFWNVETSSTSTTPIVDTIGKLKKLIIDGRAIRVDDAGKPLNKVEYPDDHDSEDEVESVNNDMAHSMASERVGFGTKSLLEQWMDSYQNSDYDEDPYDDDIYEGQDLPDKIQDICNNLDIRVRGHKKKWICFLFSLVILCTFFKEVALPISTSTTSIVERIDKFERHIIDWKLTLVDDDGNPLPMVVSMENEDNDGKVKDVVNEHASFIASTCLKRGSDSGYGINSLMEQWATKRDDDYNLYDDDLYECHDMSKNLQAICDDFDITGLRKLKDVTVTTPSLPPPSGSPTH